jgi:hypothetical protein
MTGDLDGGGTDKTVVLLNHSTGEPKKYFRYLFPPSAIWFPYLTSENFFHER